VPELKKQILFVDDEPKILAGLRRMLHGFRREWEMEFAPSASEALDRLAASPFDVVVTDMRMPGTDGSQLLEEVMQRYPATVRIVLSGQCDRRAVMRCVGPAHQFLTKPCRSETLRTTVARACRLRDRLCDEWQKRMVSRIRSVPSLPSLYAALVAELESTQASIERVAAIVSRDVGMTAKVLQLVSSGFFGTPQRVAGPAQAVNLLGLDIIKPLVFSTEAFSPCDARQEERRPLERLIDHSVAVGRAAAEIAASETDDLVLVGDARVAGLLHDVGASVLAHHLPGRYFSTAGSLEAEDEPSSNSPTSERDSPIFAARKPGESPSSSSATPKRLSLWDVENEALRATCADVGAYLMALWGLPETIVEAIAHHHFPRLSSIRAFTPLTAVHVANAFLEEEIVDVVGVPSPIDVEYLEQIGLAGRVETWREICRSVEPEGVLQ